MSLNYTLLLAHTTILFVEVGILVVVLLHRRRENDNNAIPPEEDDIKRVSVGIQIEQLMQLLVLASTPGSHINGYTLRAFLEGYNPFSIIEGQCQLYEIVVDYAKSFEDMIRAGNYGEVGKEISEENFPISAKTAQQRVHKDVALVPEHLWREVDRNMWRPASIEELLAFGAQHPDAQKQEFWIFAHNIWIERGNIGYFPAIWETDFANAPKERTIGVAHYETWFPPIGGGRRTDPDTETRLLYVCTYA